MTANVIETIGTLQELKAYCCPKVAHNKEWYLQCVDCKSLNDCTVGKHAVGLLNRQTQPKETEVSEKMSSIPKPYPKCVVEYLEAMGRPDPVRWMMERHGLNYKTAYNRLSKTKTRYPEFADKWRTAGPSSVIHKYDEPIIRKIFANADPVRYMMDTFKIGRMSARNQIHNFARKFPELEKELHMVDRICNDIHHPGPKPGFKKGEKDVKTVNDEMTVEEFLKENDAPEKAVEKAHEVCKRPPVPYNRLSKADILYESVKEKQQEIRLGIEALEKEIAEKKDQLQTLTKTLLILTNDIPVE